MKMHELLDILKKLQQTFQIDYVNYRYENDCCSCCFGPHQFGEYEGKDSLWLNKPIEEDSEEEYSFIIGANAINGTFIEEKSADVPDAFLLYWDLLELDTKKIFSEFNSLLASYDYEVDDIDIPITESILIQKKED